MFEGGDGDGGTGRVNWEVWLTRRARAKGDSTLALEVGACIVDGARIVTGRAGRRVGNAR